MQRWDITLEAVSFRNSAANRRVREDDTSCCLRAGALTQPCTPLVAAHSLCNDSTAFGNTSKIKTLQFPFPNCKFLLLEMCEMLLQFLCSPSCRQPCIAGKMKWHKHCGVPKEPCSKFWRDTAMFPRLIWLLSPVEGELKLFWIILCQISRLTKWIWLTYEKWINSCFIPNGSSFSSDDCKFHLLWFRTLAM